MKGQVFLPPAGVILADTQTPDAWVALPISPAFLHNQQSF